MNKSKSLKILGSLECQKNQIKKYKNNETNNKKERYSTIKTNTLVLLTIDMK